MNIIQPKIVKNLPDTFSFGAFIQPLSIANSFNLFCFQNANANTIAIRIIKNKTPTITPVEPPGEPSNLLNEIFMVDEMQK